MATMEDFEQGMVMNEREGGGGVRKKKRKRREKEEKESKRKEFKEFIVFEEALEKVVRLRQGTTKRCQRSTTLFM